MQLLSVVPRPPATLPPPPSKPVDDRPFFTSASPQSAHRWTGFVVSLVLHVLAVLLVPFFSVSLSDQADREPWMRHQRILETLRIHVPEQFYVAAAGSARAPEQSHDLSKQRGKPSPKPGAPGDEPRRPAPKNRPRRRRLELPPMPPRFQEPQTILQPQFAPDLAPAAAIHLPEVFFWAPQKNLPRFVKPFVQPGHEISPTQPRLLDAPPKLAIPTAEPDLTGVPKLPEATDALALVTPPALPVRTSDAQRGAPETGVSADPTSGDPTNLLSLALDPQQLREFLSVPPGNQMGRLPEGSLSGPSALRGDPGEGEPGGGGGEGGTGDGAAWRSMALAAAAPTRVVHPVGGVFDVVVQSAGTEGFPESSGVLSGRPVYAAYVRAGGSRDWLLQYCIPAEDDFVAQANGPVVRLTTATRLIAPYPRITMRPPVRPRLGGHVMVHGYITLEGRFSDLRVLGVSEPSETEMVLAVLEQWEFRPASRDGFPRRVEILLVIPTY
jgi:hypothetical protein